MIAGRLSKRGTVAISATHQKYKEFISKHGTPLDPSVERMVLVKSAISPACLSSQSAAFTLKRR
jgi:hypothetical protein